MRFRLSTLLIVLALGPLAIASGYWIWRGKPLDPAGVVVVEMNGFVNKDGVAYWERREHRRNRTVDVTIFRRYGEAPPPQDD